MRSLFSLILLFSPELDLGEGIRTDASVFLTDPHSPSFPFLFFDIAKIGVEERKSLAFFATFSESSLFFPPCPRAGGGAGGSRVRKEPSVFFFLSPVPFPLPFSLSSPLGLYKSPLPFFQLECFFSLLPLLSPSDNSDKTRSSFLLPWRSVLFLPFPFLIEKSSFHEEELLLLREIYLLSPLFFPFPDIPLSLFFFFFFFFFFFGPPLIQIIIG